jgi:hypothetical protein
MVSTPRIQPPIDRLVAGALLLLVPALQLGAPRAAGAQLTDLGAHVLTECAAPGDCLANELFGDALAVCDFDDDGFDDLAVGVHEETVGSNDNAGSLHIYYGSPAGLTSTGEQVFDLDDIGLSGGADGGDHFGEVLATGDFDLDGFCDLAVGAPSKSVGAADNHAGAVIVFFGSSGGISLSGFRFLSQNHLPAGSSESSETNDGFGSALAALPNGGLAIGVPGEDFVINTPTEEGRIHILSTSGPGNPLDSVIDREENDYAACPEQSELGDRWGSSLAVGKFGSSTSLVVAGEFEHLAGQENAGRVTVIGSPLGCFDQNSTGIQDTAEANDLFGHALAVGDFDDDGFDDLAIGVPGESIEATGDTTAGIVQVIYGSSSGLTNVGDQLWDQDDLAPNSAAEDGDWFGWALAAGDFDADGFDDLAIGVPFENISGAADVGAVNILYGDDQGLQLVGRQTFSSDFPAGMPDSSNAGDRFGAALATGDFDGNGADDLAIGMPGEALGAAAAAGAVTVTYGKLASVGAFGTVQFSSASRTVSESDGLEIVVVNRTGGAVIAASVDHARTGGTATPDLDFTYSAGSESWDPGELGSEFFILTVIDDTLDEPNQTVVISLSNPTAGTAIGEPATFTFTIVDNDVAGQVSFAQPAFGVREDAGTIEIPVVRSLGAASGVTVDYETSNATATAGSDYTTTSGTLTFDANDNLETIVVPILDDKSVETGEVFLVTLSSPGGGATLGTFTVFQAVIISDEIFLDDLETGNTSRWSATAP